jgi:hypothetical protein
VDAVRRAREVAAADDEPPRHDPRADDLARVVDVVDEAVQRADALSDAALDVRPFRGRQDARHEVERERALERRPVVAGGIERDPLLDEARIAAPSGGSDLLGTQRREPRGQGGRVGARRAVIVEELVVEPRGRAVGVLRQCDLHVAHLPILTLTAPVDHCPPGQDSTGDFANRALVRAGSRTPRLTWTASAPARAP